MSDICVLKRSQLIGMKIPQMLFLLHAALAATASAGAASNVTSRPSPSSSKPANVVNAVASARELLTNSTASSGRKLRNMISTSLADPMANAAFKTAMTAVSLLCQADHKQYCSVDTGPSTAGVLANANSPGTQLQPASGVDVRCLMRKMSSFDIESQLGTFSTKCMGALQRLRFLMAEEPQFDEALREACAGSLNSGACAAVAFDRSTLACLKAHRKRMPYDCAAEVARVMQEEARNISLDVSLYSACSAELSREPCSKRKAGGGNRRACLEQLQLNRPSALSPRCNAELTSAAILRADDIRFHAPLSRACAVERTRHCAHLTPGSMRVILCLEDHMNEHAQGTSDLGLECQQWLFRRKELVSSDFRLDAKLRNACETDILNLCANVSVGSGKVLQCLVQNQQQVSQTACKAEVHRVGQMLTSDIRLNKPLVAACISALQAGAVCGDTPIGRGRVIECLKANATKLPKPCAHEVKLLSSIQARDVHFNPLILSACREELSHKAICGGVMRDHGFAERLGCLQRKRLTPSALSADCFAAVTKDYVRSARSVDTLTKLKHHCAADLARICGYSLNKTLKGANEGGADDFAELGDISPHLTCLKARSAEIQSPLCVDEVKMLIRQTSENVLLNKPLVVACRADIKTHCAALSNAESAGDGKLLHCLEAVAQTPNSSLAPACASQLFAQHKLSLASADVNYAISRDCKHELSYYCPPKKSQTEEKAVALLTGTPAQQENGQRDLNCLQQHAYDPHFGEACVSTVVRLSQIQASDARLDEQLLSACNSSIVSLCAEAMPRSDARRGYGAVLQCLSNAGDKVGSAACRHNVRRASRTLAHFPTTNTPLLVACRDQFLQLCASEGEILPDKLLLPCMRRKRANFTGACRSKTMSMERMVHREVSFNAELSEACATELANNCADMPHDAQFKCLIRVSRQAADVSASCVAMLHEFRVRQSESLELMNRLHTDCAEDYRVLCSSATAMRHPGSGVQCLKDSKDEVTSDTCKSAILEVMGTASEDARLDPILSSACALEIRNCTVVDKIAPGQGRLHECLRRRMREGTLNRRCKQQVLSVAKSEIEDARASFPLQSACKMEMHEHCDAVPPEQMLPCLEHHLTAKQHDNSRSFSDQCAIKVRSMIQLSLHDYRLQPVVRRACEVQINERCAEVPPGDGNVLSCLLAEELASKMPGGCGSAIRGAARSGFYTFTWGQGVTRVCDDDVFDKCTGGGGAHPNADITRAVDVNGDGVYQGAEIWACLSHAAYQPGERFSSQTCRELVRMLALDPDVKAKDAERLSEELGKELAKQKEEHARALRQRKQEMDESNSQAAARSQQMIASAQAEVTSKMQELDRLREQLEYQKFMAEKLEKLSKESEAKLQSGILVHPKLILFVVILLLLAAIAALRQRQLSPASKGYQVLLVPKDT